MGVVRMEDKPEWRPASLRLFHLLDFVTPGQSVVEFQFFAPRREPDRRLAFGTVEQPETVVAQFVVIGEPARPGGPGVSRVGWLVALGHCSNSQGPVLSNRACCAILAQT